MTLHRQNAADYRASRRRWRWSWPITISGLVALVCILIVSLWGYDCWANSVRPFYPVPPPMPTPNGYERAVALLAQLPPEPSPQGTYYHWPDAPPEALRKAVRPALPTLDALRETFNLDWQRPLPPPLRVTPDLAQFRGCARYFSAASLLAQRGGDNSAAMQRKLDGMELGAKMCRGGALLPLLVGSSIHAIGFAGAERLVPQLPVSGIPSALSRVRRIRREWPQYASILEVERVAGLRDFSQAAIAYRHRTPLGTLGFIGVQLRPPWTTGLEGERQALASWLTPKRSALNHLDRYYRSLVAEHKKPYQQRRLPTVPTDAFFQNSLLDPRTGAWAEAKWWRPQLDLALLETALAVRLYRLENGRFPARLSEIPKQWLPAVPGDPWGQPIAYRLKNGNPLIYSFGPDGRDDGGRPADALQLNASTRGDLVWGSLARRRQ